MPEVADVLAAANSFDAYRFLTIEMHPAALAGALTLTNPEFGGPLVGRDSMEFHDWVTPANLDAWLERAGFPFRWPLKPEPQAATPAPVSDSASDAPDTSKGTPPKLTEVDKAEIQRLYNRGRGAPVNAMAKQFNVSRPTIEKVLRRAGIKK